MFNMWRFLPTSIALLIALIVTPAVGAQSSTPVAGSTPVGVLSRVRINALPSPVGEVWFLGLSVAPGSAMQVGKADPTVIYVESGSLTVTADQPVGLSGGAGATPVVAAENATVASAGQTVSINGGTTVSFQNDGDQRAGLLILFIVSAEHEAETAEQEAQTDSSGTPEPEQQSEYLIGATGASFPQGPVVVTIERTRLEPAAVEHVDVNGGAVVGGIEHGSATLRLNERVGASRQPGCWIWPKTMIGKKVESERMRPGVSSVELTESDGFSCANRSVTWQAGTQGATVIRAVVQPLSTATPVATSAS